MQSKIQGTYKMSSLEIFQTLQKFTSYQLDNKKVRKPSSILELRVCFNKLYRCFRSPS